MQLIQLRRSLAVTGLARILLYSLVVSAAVMPLSAQIGGGGSVQGVVSDATGAVIPGAVVEATNVATGIKTTRQTTAAGYYVLSPLPAGVYTIAVTAGGFQRLLQENVTVDALSTVGLDATLQIGMATETVTVTDVAPALNTSDARMGQTMRNETYTALPLAMGIGGASINAPRDPTAFVALMPGVTGYGSNRAGNVAGGQTGSAEVYVEGLAITNPVLQGEVRNLSLGISIEAVEQFQLETAGSAVMYAGQGSTNFVLKSGTNDLHGSVYEYFRNTVLDARGFFAASRPVHRQNAFGGTVGGPIKRNRVFFFGGYDGYRNSNDTRPTLVSLPTMAARSGDFSGFPVAIFDPQSTNCANGPCTRSAFPNNTVPQNRISQKSNFFQSFLPAVTNNNLQNNYLGSVPVGFANNSVTGKVDASLNDNHQVYGLFSIGKRNMTTDYRNGNVPLPYTDTRTVTETMTTAQMRHTWIISPTVLNQISYGFSRFWVPITNATIDGDWMQQAGLTGLPPGEAASAFPYITFNGPNSPLGWRVGNSEAFDEATNTFTLQNNLQWTRGSHSLTFGGQFQWLQANEKLRSYGSRARWTFSNTQTAGFSPTGTLQATTGNSYASYLLGGVNSLDIVDDFVVGVGARFRRSAWWIQDNIKVTQRLTLNLGLRHDVMSPWVEVRDRMSWVNPTLANPAIGGSPGALVFAGYGQNSCQCRNALNTYYMNYQPRIGLAFSLNPKTVLRAGYGVTTTPRGSAGGSASGKIGTNLLGFSAEPSFNSLDNGISPAFYWENNVPPYQKAPFFDLSLNTGFTTTQRQGGPITYGDPNSRPPRYQSWNFSIQRSLFSDLTLDVAYVGSNGHYLSGNAPRGFFGGGGQIRPEYLALGNLLLAPATPANVAAAQAIRPEVGLPYANFSGSISQMLRPFPQYSSVGDPWGNVGNSNYNSMQVILRKATSQGLTFDMNYTLVKAFDNLETRNHYFSEKAQTIDSTHTVNALVVYRLPFGRGQRFGSDNAVVSAIAGGWQISGVTTYRSGTGFGLLAAACNLPNAGTCYAQYNPNFSGPVRINGSYGSGDLLGSAPPSFVDRNAFVSPAAFTYGDTPRTLAHGLRNPSSFNQSLSLRREFVLHENWKLAVQADALNVFNGVDFANPNTTITSANFGRISGQANQPRVVQFNARVTF